MFSILGTGPTVAASSGNWTTFGRDPQRTGFDPDNTTFFCVGCVSQAWSKVVDGVMQTQPLVWNNKVYVATENNTVFAFDATSPTGAQVWSTSLGPPAPVSAVQCPVPAMGPVLGVTSTPVIDPATGHLYLVAQKSVPNLHYELWTLDANTGLPIGAHPTIDPWPGTADQKAATNAVELQRGALLLANGLVYIEFGSRGDCGAYHGWIAAVPVGPSGAQSTGELAWEATAGTLGGGVWAPGGPSLDTAGNVWAGTGNSFSAPEVPYTGPTYDGSDAVVKLSPTLKLMGFFSPANWIQLNQNDVDIAAVSTVQLGNGLIFQTGKAGVGYLLRASDFTNPNQTSVSNGAPLLHSATICPAAYGAAAWDATFSLLYVPCGGLAQIQINASAQTFVENWTGPGTTSGAGDGSGPPIIADQAVWYVNVNSNTLYALNSANHILFQTVLPTQAAHFASPASGLGMIFVPTSGRLTAYQPNNGAPTPTPTRTPTPTFTPAPPSPTASLTSAPTTTTSTPSPMAASTSSPTATPSPASAVPVESETPTPISTPTLLATSQPASPTPTPAPPSGGGGGRTADSGGGVGGPGAAGAGPAAPPAAPVTAPALEVAGVQRQATTPPSPSRATPATPMSSPLSLPPLSFDAGARPAGDTLEFVLSAGASQVELPASHVLLTVPAAALSGSSTPLAQVVEVAVDSLPALPGNDFQRGVASFEMRLMDLQSGQPIQSGSGAPLTLTYQVGSAELAIAGGDLSRVTWTFWNDGQWTAVPCVRNTSTNTLTCTISHLSLFAEMIAPNPGDVLDFDIAGGHFFQQANGFGGAGSLGYAVTDDADASFWTEFSRLGGVQEVGYPISARFQYKGFLTQAFQKLVLQWRPELGLAVPLNALDELNGPGLNGWLDSTRQVPPAQPNAADAGLSWNVVQARHVALLDPYPDLETFYTGAESAEETYGLPLAVKDYGAFVTARLQRATLQLWPGPNGPTIVAGNAGDLAKEAGLWPPSALALSPAPTPADAGADRSD